MTLDFMAALRRDGSRFADLLADGDLGAAVPSCPGWDVAELGHHLAEVYRFWATVVGERLDSPDGVAMLPRPHDVEVPTQFLAQLEYLLEVFDAVPADTPVWAWWGPATVSDVVQRMAHETSVHLWDLQNAHGDPDAVDAALASDGIDEMLTRFLPFVGEAYAAVGGSVHVHCTDVAGEWTVFPTDDGRCTITREHAKGDCALRGTSSELLLAMWRRTSITDLDVVGDQQVAERFLALGRLD